MYTNFISDLSEKFSLVFNKVQTIADYFNQYIKLDNNNYETVDNDPSADVFSLIAYNQPEYQFDESFEFYLDSAKTEGHPENATVEEQDHFGKFTSVLKESYDVSVESKARFLSNFSDFLTLKFKASDQSLQPVSNEMTVVSKDINHSATPIQESTRHEMIAINKQIIEPTLQSVPKTLIHIGQEAGAKLINLNFNAEIDVLKQEATSEMIAINKQIIEPTLQSVPKTLIHIGEEAGAKLINLNFNAEINLLNQEATSEVIAINKGIIEPTLQNVPQELIHTAPDAQNASLENLDYEASASSLDAQTDLKKSDASTQESIPEIMAVNKEVVTSKQQNVHQALINMPSFAHAALVNVDIDIYSHLDKAVDKTQNQADYNLYNFLEQPAKEMFIREDYIVVDGLTELKGPQFCNIDNEYYSFENYFQHLKHPIQQPISSWDISADELLKILFDEGMYDKELRQQTITNLLKDPDAMQLYIEETNMVDVDAEKGIFKEYLELIKEDSINDFMVKFWDRVGSYDIEKLDDIILDKINDDANHNDYAIRLADMPLVNKFNFYDELVALEKSSKAEGIYNNFMETAKELLSLLTGNENKDDINDLTDTSSREQPKNSWDKSADELVKILFDDGMYDKELRQQTIADLLKDPDAMQLYIEETNMVDVDAEKGIFKGYLEFVNDINDFIVKFWDRIEAYDTTNLDTNILNSINDEANYNEYAIKLADMPLVNKLNFYDELLATENEALADSSSVEQPESSLGIKADGLIKIVFDGSLFNEDARHQIIGKALGDLKWLDTAMQTNYYAETSEKGILNDYLTLLKNDSEQEFNEVIKNFSDAIENSNDLNEGRFEDTINIADVLDGSMDDDLADLSSPNEDLDLEARLGNIIGAYSSMDSENADQMQMMSGPQQTQIEVATPEIVFV